MSEKRFIVLCEASTLRSYGKKIILKRTLRRPRYLDQFREKKRSSAFRCFPFGLSTVFWNMSGVLVHPADRLPAGTRVFLVEPGGKMEGLYTVIETR
jgi:hypothetical protein